MNPTSGPYRSRGRSRRRSSSICSVSTCSRSPTTSCASTSSRAWTCSSHAPATRRRSASKSTPGRPVAGERLWEIVLEAGKPHGLTVIGPCHIRRIEGGILAYGADMWLDTNPYEVDLGYEWMVDLEQEADFVGKEALRRIKEQGISRKLVGVEIGGAGLGSYNDGSMIDFFPVYADGQAIGRVTSACYSPRLEKNIGYAMVPIEHAELGTELEVETPTERTSAVVVRRPFISREGDSEAGS